LFGSFHPHNLLQNCYELIRLTFAGVCGPNSGNDRRLLWDELAGIINWWNLSWCIRGDFNVTRFLSERSSEVRLCSAVRDFSDFISHQDLMDLPLADGSFTWLLKILLYGLGLIISLSP